MMSGYDLYDSLQKKIKELEEAVNRLEETGTALAQAEKDYKIELAKEALNLKRNNIAVSMISYVIYGQEKIADLRYKRDIAEAVYNANQESINSIKLQIRILESQLSREMGRVKYE